LSDANLGIGEQCSRSFKVVFCKLRRPAARAAGAPGGGKAGLGPLTDQTALEFRECAEHVKNEPPLRGRRIEGFRQTAKPDASHPQVLDGFDQLLHRSRQAIELPHDQRVAAAREFKRVVQGGPVSDRAGHLLGENLLAPSFGQCIALQGKVLVDGLLRLASVRVRS